jgi:hypothetical protein
MRKKIRKETEKTMLAFRHIKKMAAWSKKWLSQTCHLTATNPYPHRIPFSLTSKSTIRLLLRSALFPASAMTILGLA